MTLTDICKNYLGARNASRHFTMRSDQKTIDLIMDYMKMGCYDCKTYDSCPDYKPLM